MSRPAVTSSRRRRFAALVIVLGAVGATASVARAQNPPETIEYYATDALGSVRVVFTPTGQVIGRSDYLPFGDTQEQSGMLPRQRFTGQERDGVAGLDDFNARSLQMRTGRMSSPDPLFGNALTNPQRWNRYAYACNNPLTLVDPTGMSDELPELGELDPWRYWDDMTGDLVGWQAGAFSGYQRTLAAAGYSFTDAWFDAQGGGLVVGVDARSLAASVPAQVKKAVSASVEAANNQTCGGPGFVGPCRPTDDLQGGNHEEGGWWGFSWTSSPQLVVVAAQPGPYCPPGPGRTCSIQMMPVDQEVANSLDMLGGRWHVHPSAAGWVQSPSLADLATAGGFPINIVVGARDQQVYFYFTPGVVGHVSLRTFLSRGGD